MYFQQTLCSEMSEEFRFAVSCLSTKKEKGKGENEEITDNGLQFMPLTSNFNQNLGNNAYGNKEVYA